MKSLRILYIVLALVVARCPVLFSQQIKTQVIIADPPPDPGGGCDDDTDCCIGDDFGDCDPAPPEGGGGGGGSCSNTQTSYFTTYTDETIDAGGNFDAWSVSDNSDGVSGQGTLTAWVSGIMPDGTVIVDNVVQSDYAPSATSSLTYSGINNSPGAQGQLFFGANVDWDCGTFSIVQSSPLFRLAYTNFQFSTYFMGGCDYTQDCGATTATCGSLSAIPAGYTAPNCPAYLYEGQLVVSGVCIPVGHYTTGPTPRACT